MTLAHFGVKPIRNKCSRIRLFVMLGCVVLGVPLDQLTINPEIRPGSIRSRPQVLKLVGVHELLLVWAPLVWAFFSALKEKITKEKITRKEKKNYQARPNQYVLFRPASVTTACLEKFYLSQWLSLDWLSPCKLMLRFILLMIFVVFSYVLHCGHQRPKGRSVTRHHDTRQL